MLSEVFFSSTCGPPLSSNTAIARDVGIYAHSLWPTFAAKATFRNSATPPNCLAVNETHIFAAQHGKAYVHVYSRLRGSQEVFVAFPERIRCLTLAGAVLVLGTVEGSVMLWEVCTGRLVSPPPRHVQAVSCLAASPYRLLSGSDDSNVHVWSLAQLLDLNYISNNGDGEPTISFSSHRGAITAIAASASENPETSFCVSASKDRTCIVWNFVSGVVLRTLLFSTSPLCLVLHPCSNTVCVSTEDGSVFSVDFFASMSMLGPGSEESSTLVQVTSPFAVVPPDSGPASCLGLTYDGSVLVSGHPKGQIFVWNLSDQQAITGAKLLGNLNAAVMNIAFVPPLTAGKESTKTWTVVKPSQVPRPYTYYAQFENNLKSETRTCAMIKRPGFPDGSLETAISTLLFLDREIDSNEASLCQAEEQWELINQQKSAHEHGPNQHTFFARSL